MSKNFSASVFRALLSIGGLLFLLSGCSKAPYYDAYFPITFVPYSGEPQTDVTIQGNTYPLMIDLGSSNFVSLRPDILDKLQKDPYRTLHFTDIKGADFAVQTFMLPELKIRNMWVRPVEACEESFEFSTKGSLLYSSRKESQEEIYTQKAGRIGRCLFQGHNLFLDFYRSSLFVCSHLSDRKVDGYDLRKLSRFPFELGIQDGIIFVVKTDLGPKKFILDTGSTLSLLKPSCLQNQITTEGDFGLRFYHSFSFILGGKNFGEIDLALLEIPASFGDLDGIIGMDFLKNHIVYLDFAKKEAWIGKASECMRNRQNELK